MFGGEKNIFIAIGVVIVLAVVFVFFVWFSSNDTRAPGQEAAEISFPSPESSTFQPDRSRSLENDFSGSVSRGQNISSSQFLSLGQGISSEFPQGNLGEEIDIFFETAREIFLPSFPGTSPAFSPPPLATSVGITEQELFEFAYPDDYRNTLSEINQSMIADGFLEAGQTYPLNSFEEVNLFQDKFIEYIKFLGQSSDNGGISETELEIYRKAYNELLPKLWQEELESKKKSEQSALLPAVFFYNYKKIAAHKKIQRLTDFLKSNLTFAFISVAEAQFSAGSECYRGGSPNLTRGSQRAAPCCNCGFRCTRRGCTFVQNCGPNGGSCNVQLGCLNRACANLPAIWDPSTGICGCYI